MPKASPIQSSFNGGEVSPLLFGRVDLDLYKTSLATCLNGIPLLQGPWVNRSGSKYVANVKTAADKTRLIPFVFSTVQAYVIELGAAYYRFYRDRGQIIDGGSPYEIVSVYAIGDVSTVKYTQSADTLYLAHTAYPPQKVTRTGHTAWTQTEIDFLDGPYMNINVETTTLAASAATGSVTVTASAVTGINSDTGFQDTDIGRLIRIIDGANWGWGKITARASTTVVTVLVREGTFPTGTTTTWRLGLWSATTGYPAAVSFFENRLVWGGGVDFPQVVAASKSGAFENMAPTDLDGTVTAASALNYTLNSSEVNAVFWLSEEARGLVIGTEGGIWVMRPSLLGEAVTATNIKASRISKYGSADVQATVVGGNSVYVQRGKEKVRNVQYVNANNDDSFSVPDLTKAAEHITKSGVNEIQYQLNPYSIMWGVRGDGVLLGLSIDELDKVNAWHRHALGGFSDAAKTVAAKVESVAVIPSVDGVTDDVWVTVQRYIDGATVRYVEFLMPIWRDGDDQNDAFFVDSGLTYDGVPATVMTGLDHLEGETVAILSDGHVHPTQVVASGQVTLTHNGSKVHIGLGYNSDGETLNLEAGAADGTAQGKTKRINKLFFKLLASLGLKTGPTSVNMKVVNFRKPSDPMGQSVPLFTGDKEVQIPPDYSKEGRVYWRQSDPLPLIVLAIMPQLHTQDR